MQKRLNEKLGRNVLSWKLSVLVWTSLLLAGLATGSLVIAVITGISLLSA